MIKIYKVRPERLIFKDIQQIDFELSIPILINEKKEVICGNCCKNTLLKRNTIEVIVLYNSNSFVENTLYNIEKEVAKEDVKRFHTIEEDIKKYIRNENSNIEMMPLFEIREERCINEDVFVKPPPYNFTKAKKKKQIEESRFVDLFTEGGEQE